MGAIRDGKLLSSKTYATKDHAKLITALQDFIKHNSITPTSCCLALAGPIINQTCSLTNEHSTELYSAAEFTEKLGFSVQFINDFAAVGWSLVDQTTIESKLIFDHPIHENGAVLYIGAGTGLGVGYLTLGDQPQIYCSEGGHMRFAAVDAFDFALVLFLKQKY